MTNEHNSPGDEPSTPQASEIVYLEIRSRIMNGQLKMSEKLTQSQLCEEFSVSRTPVREALRRLEQERLVESTPNSGARVRELDLDEVEGVYASRILLDTFAARYTLPLLDSADITTLERHLLEMTDAAVRRDNDAFERPHRAFHAILVSKTYPALSTLITELGERTERFRRIFRAQDSVRWETGHDEHRTIYAAVADRDADTLVRLLATHLATTALYVITGADPTRGGLFIRRAHSQATGDQTAPDDSLLAAALRLRPQAGSLESRLNRDA